MVDVTLLLSHATATKCVTANLKACPPTPPCLGLKVAAVSTPCIHPFYQDCFHISPPPNPKLTTTITSITDAISPLMPQRPPPLPLSSGSRLLLRPSCPCPCCSCASSASPSSASAGGRGPRHTAPLPARLRCACSVVSGTYLHTRTHGWGYVHDFLKQ